MIDHNEDPIELSQKFWKSMCVKGGMTSVNSMISPDCFLKDGFGSSARGIHNSEAISIKLSEINEKIYNGVATFEKEIPFRLMRNKVQVRFLTSAKVGWLSITIGFALEFECGFIVKIVLMKNPGKGIFEIDDTQEAVVKPVVVKMDVVDNTVAEVKSVKDTVREDKDKVADDKNNNGNGNSNSNGMIKEEPKKEVVEEVRKKMEKKEEDADHSFYFGKFLGRARPSRDSSDYDEPDDDTPQLSLARTLRPPFLTSKPPEIPPTVVVTVVGCMHLRSPLKRVIERDVNAYVSVKMKSMPVIQSTPPAQSGTNPMFTLSNKFVFEAPSTGGTVVFKVFDKKSIGDDLLIAEVHVPLASIATTSPSNSTPTALSLPLHMHKQMSRFTKQKHRPSISGSSHLDEHDPDNEPAVLDVQISKIDIMKWWALEELKARDEARDKKEAEEEAARLREHQVQIDQKNATAKKKAAVLSGKGKHVDNDVKFCSRCKEEFTLFKRKHHCHFCLMALCDDCSPDEALLDGVMHRCCKVCMADPKRATSSKEDQAVDTPAAVQKQYVEKIATKSTRVSSAVKSENAQADHVSQVLSRVESTDAKWEHDDSTQACRICNEEFSFFLCRRHHCRVCGRLVCGNCSPEEVMIAGMPERCCTDCFKIHGSNEDEDVDETECSLS